MTKILVTGGCGFIGANLVTELARRGENDIVVFDNESLGKREHLLGFSGAFTKGDLQDRGALRRALKGVDVVVHLAAHTRVIESVEDPRSNFNDNVIGTFNLLDECRHAGVKRLINASTGGAILGEAPSPVHEGLVPAPLSAYGASKLAAEGYCSAFSGSYGIKCASLRFSNIYGPRSYHKDSVVARFIKQILVGKDLVIYGDGSQVRDYLFIGDLVAGIAEAIRSDCTGVFQLGAGRPTTLNELLDVLRAVVGEDAFPKVGYVDARAGEVHTTWCNISKAKEAFGYNPSTDLSKGVQATWDWFTSTRSSKG